MMKKTMTSLFLVGFISASLLFTSACQKPVEVDPGPTQEEIDAKAAEVAAAKAKAEAEAAAAKARAEAEAAAAKARAEAEAARIAQEAMAAMESEWIYFDYDSSELKSDAQDTLTKKAAWLKANGSYKLKIGGHCDDRGSTEYNIALGSRRAEAAAKFLNALGISEGRLDTVSYGEEKPAVDGKDESAWSQNRRDEFELIQ